jgi:plasmid stabilization system protein ParE
MRETGMRQNVSALALSSPRWSKTTITEVLQNPLAYPRVRADTRRGLVRRFPYAVYFRPTADEIVVLAVMHGRRNPRRWRSRR